MAARRTLSEDLYESPIPSTVDKLWEAWFFLLGATDRYHDPHAFRYNLNAFIQALRNITFILQAEENKPETFGEWYNEQRIAMASDSNLKRFVQTRNLVVKRQMLGSHSVVRIGIFRGRMLKLGVGGPINHFRTSAEILEQAQQFFLGLMMDEEHGAINEQLGVFREWHVEAIGENEVVSHCTEALRYLAALVESAHRIWGTGFDASFDLPSMQEVQVLLESDVDPSLPRKWGWVNEEA